MDKHNSTIDDSIEDWVSKKDGLTRLNEQYITKIANEFEEKAQAAFKNIYDDYAQYSGKVVDAVKNKLDAKTIQEHAEELEEDQKLHDAAGSADPDSKSLTDEDYQNHIDNYFACI